MARKRRSEYSFLQYRSNMRIFAEAYKKIENHIKPIHLELMERTPFWGLFKTYREGIATNDAWKNDYDVIDILETYNKDLKCFDIGGKRLTITAADIAAIFGLPDGGKAIEHGTRLSGSRTKFMKRKFGNLERLTKTAVESRMIEACKGSSKCDPKDFVRLVCIYFCVTLLFCNTNTIISWKLVSYCEDVNKMKEYAWSNATADFLDKSLAKKSNHVTGCVAALLYWLCEKTHIISPIHGRENMTPRFVRWNLAALHEFLDEVDLRTMEPYEESSEDVNAMSETSENVTTHRLQSSNNLVLSYRDPTTKSAADITPITYQNTRKSITSEWVAMGSNGNERVNVEVTPNRTSENKALGSMRHSISSKVGPSDFPNWTLIPSQSFDNASEEAQPLIMVTNMENLQRENEKLKMELSKLNIRCEVAEVTADLLSESVNIAESSLEKLQAEKNVLEAENHTLRKEIAGLRNGDPEIGMPPQRSMVRGLKNKQRKKVVLEDFECEPLVNRIPMNRSKGKCDGRAPLKKTVGLIIEEGGVGYNQANLIKKRKHEPVDDYNNKTDGTNQKGNIQTMVEDSKRKKPMTTPNPSLDILNNNVGKCLDGKDMEKLDKYLRSTTSSEPLWEGDMAAVFKQDVEFLLKELGLRTCAIDAFSEILSIRQSLDPTGKMKSLFMPTH